MNMVASRSFNLDSEPLLAAGGRIARVEVFDDMAAAEPHWRALERANTLATPYQRYDFLKHWQRHVGTGAGIIPFIVVGFDVMGSPLFLLPLGVRKLAGLRVVEFLGGKHTNYNMGLWRQDAVATIGEGELRAMLDRLAERADLLQLTSQPLTWNGTANPLALLPHQASANFSYSGALMSDFEALLNLRIKGNSRRKKMRSRERGLARYGAVHFERASDPDNARRILAAFLQQKGARLRARGLADVFASDDVRQFLEAAATERLAEGAAAIELHALSVDGDIVATVGGITGGGRFCAMFNSIAEGRCAAQSPGEQLIINVVRQCCERGFDTFDLGVGEARYKAMFCSDPAPMFESYLPLTTAGRLPALAMAAVAAAKRAIKQHPALWSFVSSLRRLRAHAA